jgi:hypothetical protein
MRLKGIGAVVLRTLLVMPDLPPAMLPTVGLVVKATLCAEKHHPTCGFFA